MRSRELRILAALLLIAVPVVELGGSALLGMLSRRDPKLLRDTLRPGVFRAGHAAVWIVLALLAMLYVSWSGLSAAVGIGLLVA